LLLYGKVDSIMSYWLLPVCIIMGCFTWPAAKWVIVNYYCKTVPEPDFMEKDQVKARRIDVSKDMGQIINIEV